ncbi:MAG: hypothetical protein L0287_16930 [Anaerolineae bacterium]|nr:hypothetical protein [Anaerolineae bacterium]MCI0607691.1 hypothetical protein [Anaerolineae bacterium]
MEQKHLTNWTAIVIGFLLSVGVSLALLLILPGAGYFTSFIFTSIKAAFPLGIIGALIGKYFSETRIGILLGAALMIFLGFWVIYSIASMLPLD